MMDDPMIRVKATRKKAITINITAHSTHEKDIIISPSQSTTEGLGKKKKKMSSFFSFQFLLLLLHIMITTTSSLLSFSFTHQYYYYNTFLGGSSRRNNDDASSSTSILYLLKQKQQSLPSSFTTTTTTTTKTATTTKRFTQQSSSLLLGETTYQSNKTNVDDGSTVLLPLNNNKIKTETTTTQTKKTKTTTCSHCSKTFPSRNTLFRHIRNDPICSLKESLMSSSSKGTSSIKHEETVKESVAVLFGYEPLPSSCLSGTTTATTACDIGVLVQETIINSLRNTTAIIMEEEIMMTLDNNNINTTTTINSNNTIIGGVEFVSSTQASIAKMRRKALQQEINCFSTGDVIVLNVKVPKKFVVTNNNNIYWTKAMQDANDKLKPHGVNILKFQRFHNHRKQSKQQKTLHGEQGCTQRIYHYLMPLSWLPNGTDIQNWWKSSSSEDEIEHSRQQQNHHHHETKQHRRLHMKPPTSLRRFKDALRSSECIKRSPISRDSGNGSSRDDGEKNGVGGTTTTTNTKNSNNNNNNNNRIASGRFGALGLRERRAWHNFADPSLRGDASPNNEPVWRVLDRARIVEFAEFGNGDDDNEVIAVLEFKGDSFVQQQIRRIVGSAVAMSHGWLPNNYFDLATDPQTYVETPLAPSGRLYFAKARYHFEEMLAEGKPLFDNHKSRNIVDLDDDDSDKDSAPYIRRLQTLMLQQKVSEKSKEMKWLEELQTVTCKQILNRLSGTVVNKKPTSIERTGQVITTPKQIPSSSSTATTTNHVPDFHLPVLNELRRILSEGEWPETSIARSNVIRQFENNSEKDNDEHDDTDSDSSKGGGSFTIVNPKVANKNWDILPMGNELFKDLVDLVFELEMNLIKTSQVARVTTIDGQLVLQKEEDDNDDDAQQQPRSPSSHCAVNCNAQFTPHVDSGRGAGQSMSMIIGLGQYHGGELQVEGEEHDIQHRPLEFDGWRLRHWTNPFEGERFSLVWFTPERSKS